MMRLEKGKEKLEFASQTIYSTTKSNEDGEDDAVKNAYLAVNHTIIMKKPNVTHVFIHSFPSIVRASRRKEVARGGFH